ncbi:hypothetical protein BG000_009717 [Podila horticola]|nr:hypothetical protein BG000_009717 [Podila horticola]
MEQHSYSGDQLLVTSPEGPTRTYQDQRRHTLHGTDWTLGLSLDRLNTYSSIAGQSNAATEVASSDEDSENEEANSENDYKFELGSTSTSGNTSHPFDYAISEDSSIRPQKQPYLNPGDAFGRRASMSQLSLYGDVWGQVK